MSKQFSLRVLHNQKTISFYFDITGDCYADKHVQEIKHFALAETTGFVSIYDYFCDAFFNAVRLLKSGKELYVSIGTTVTIDGKSVSLPLCDMSTDLQKETIRLKNGDTEIIFFYSGGIKKTNNPNFNTAILSGWIKDIRNSQSVEKELKKTYFQDMQDSNLANITFYPYIKKQEKERLFKEIIRAAHYVRKAVDMSQLYPFTVTFKNIREKNTVGQWYYSYKAIELDWRCDRDMIRSAFYHEYGHLIFDYAIIGDFLSPSIKKKAMQIICTMLSILNNGDTMNSIDTATSKNLHEYLQIPAEMFARLFASYMIYEYDLKASFEESHFCDAEMLAVSSLLNEFFRLLHSDEEDHDYRCVCCGISDKVKFYELINPTHDLIQYEWLCPECLKYNEGSIGVCRQISIDTIPEEKLNYLITTR